MEENPEGMTLFYRPFKVGSQMLLLYHNFIPSGFGVLMGLKYVKKIRKAFL